MGKQAKILVVDDEKDVCAILKDFLIDYQFEVLTAESGYEALEIIDSEKVDLVISDLVMPRMDGIALTRAIMELGLNIPVIIMTGYASIDSAVASMKAGAADFITKPFKFNHTLFIVKKVLETKRLQELARQSDYYKKLSYLDDLTGVSNHRYFKQMLDNEIQRHCRYEHPLSLIMADIDNFKDVNDRYGHLMGDQVLITVADLIKKSIRGFDLLARYGGEEFCVILPETAMDEALVVGKRIVSTVSQYPFKITASSSEETFNLSLTAGLASFPEDAEDAKKLVAAADRALYLGKESGKNCICTHRDTN
jgi:two-component system cell cycle response regulator